MGKAIISLIPVEPLNDAHGALIVDAFNRLFVEGGGEADGWGDGDGYGDAHGDGYGYGRGTGDGDGFGDGSDGVIPEEWQVK